MIFERLKALFIAGVIKDLTIYVTKEIITEEQAFEIIEAKMALQ
jgi:hypothetical protein